VHGELLLAFDLVTEALIQVNIRGERLLNFVLLNQQLTFQCKWNRIEHCGKACKRFDHGDLIQPVRHCGFG